VSYGRLSTNMGDELFDSFDGAAAEIDADTGASLRMDSPARTPRLMRTAPPSFLLVMSHWHE
jgi:hypothetical protein